MMDVSRVRTVEIAGCSMEPLLPLGARVVVVANGADAVSPGDIVLLETPTCRVIHRLIWLGVVDEQPVVFHRGEINGGGIGVAAATAVVGSAVAVISSPRGRGFEDNLAAIDAPKGLWLAAWRCRAFCCLHRLGRLVPTGLRRWARRKLLAQ
ncbi:MAG: hypothetical protein GY906_05370 [bacterium]|nr:hypothetical protein [bacterium]